MPNKTRLRKVMTHINTLAKDAPDNATWNQGAWWDGDDYVVAEGHELHALTEKYDCDKGAFVYETAKSNGGDPIKCNASGC